MRRDEELHHLQRVRQVVADKRLCASIADQMTEQAKLDLLGSSFEARSDLCWMYGKPFGTVEADCDDEIRSLLIAACSRCSRYCKHVSPSEVIYAFLAPRVLMCRACIPNFVSMFLAHDLDRPNSDECDLCLKTGVEFFYEAAMQFANVVLHGDICGDCNKLCKTGELKG